MNSALDSHSFAASVDDPFYYLINFRFVLDWVGERYGDLLDARELEVIAAFHGLPQASQALLVRMIMRKGTLFRASKLAYPEIGATREAAEPLITQGLIDAAPELTLDALFGLLTKAELVAAFKDHLGNAKARKPALLEALRPSFPGARRFAVWCPASDDRVYALPLMALCDRLRLMFFGNLRQDFSEFVLADLGIFRYERVAFSQASRAFQDRGDVDAYLHLHRCRERFEAGDALEAVLAEVPPAFVDNPWLESRRAKLLYQLGQHCERHALLHIALRLYEDCSHPGARLRRLRVLERSERFETALELAGEMELTPESEAEIQHLGRVVPRLRRKLGLARPVRRDPAPVERIDLVLPRPEDTRRVESVVREHLDEATGPVHYVENALVNSLFGLLCWEAIFAPLPGAFFHPFHGGPADLLRPDFQARRQAWFDACLAQLDSNAYRATIRKNFVAKQGLQSPFVHWGILDEALLERALACFPATHLRLWFERLLRDIKANRAGLPDLIQFWPDRDAGGDQAQPRYRMIEVKGPGDRLQDNQLRWLDFCAEHGMPVTVCYVQWQQDGTAP
ncbi:VRR-NUC domain-containing protein [Modicisalibacter ilicicola DSM 19980]|uniref:phosphodiesterase I n=1 Tax=Modicisalibacter ilicicola DSM 19980 TaxID=1121942 RepID=A0A1M5AVC4_9GAMM|nr:VRR-NUC domain-containing protein [Halomonas ilicicola]SHF34163.1 VRR-NUC domain-containing protein [Halomonas ilicicola DSM 19980]